MTRAYDLPASLALVKATVSNHIGKKYMTAKLQFATRKFDIPIRTGTFWRRRKGAKTGSGVNSSSTIMKIIISAAEAANGAITDGEFHLYG